MRAFMAPLTAFSLLSLAWSGCASRVDVTRAPTQVTAALPAPPRPAAPPQGDGLNVNVGGDVKAIYFGFDAATLTPEAEKDLARVAERLRADPKLTVRFEGNCDERGTTEYNLALGDLRARAAQRYLVQQGIAASRITTVSYGKERPVVDGHDEESWAKNRRDDVVFRKSDG